MSSAGSGPGADHNLESQQPHQDSLEEMLCCGGSVTCTGWSVVTLPLLSSWHCDRPSEIQDGREQFTHLLLLLFFSDTLFQSYTLEKYLVVEES